MGTGQKASQWVSFLIAILILGVIGDVLFFFFLYTRQTNAAYSAQPTETSTSQVFTLAENGTLTNTPFQPLPTNTPTPTATFTPTPTATRTPRPTKTPAPTNAPSDGLPESAAVDGVHSYMQAHSLSCEARSAVDFAAFFGVSISENDFQAKLPKSDNPDRGFVGSPDGAEGQIPPNSYGVYAKPIADLLNDYGLSAIGVKEVTLKSIKAEIAHGHPVIAWVVGNVWYGTPELYTTSDGSVVPVVPFEHTVLVTAYDEYGLTIMDGNMIYWRSTDEFLQSWAVLGNMIVFHK